VAGQRPGTPPSATVALERFKGRPYRVKPISAYPKPVGMEPYPKKNPETGIPDGKYTVEMEQRLDANTAKVSDLPPFVVPSVMRVRFGSQGRG
jgi:hypothetical protein